MAILLNLVKSIWSDGYLSRERILSVTQPGMAVALLQFILVIPATNATPERLFTVLRHLKSYLRTTTLQERLNYLMLLHVHKEWTDALDMQAVLTELIGESELRCGIFATYTNLFEQNESVV